MVLFFHDIQTKKIGRMEQLCYIDESKLTYHNCCMPFTVTNRPTTFLLKTPCSQMGNQTLTRLSNVVFGFKPFTLGGSKL